MQKPSFLSLVCGLSCTVVAHNSYSITIVDNQVDVLQNIGWSETSVNAFDGNEFTNHGGSPNRAHRWGFKTQSVELASLDGSNGFLMARQEVSQLDLH